jgi:hypothetical protein
VPLRLRLAIAQRAQWPAPDSANCIRQLRT